MYSCQKLIRQHQLLQLVSSNKQECLSIWKRQIFNRAMIGNRDVVGFGKNGSYTYIESPQFAFPAVRWKENTPEIMALREKEKGDWRKMTVDEKKQLYRASFCQTFAEMDAPTGEWKYVVGFSLALLGIGLWMCVYIKLFAATPFPVTMTDPERRAANLRRMLDLRVNPIDGLSSKWDYEKDQWKK